jgi:hypothetical protein
MWWHSSSREIINNTDIQEGEQEIIMKVAGFKYPLKIVLAVENDIATVITNYPLKKGGADESAVR